MVYQCFQSLMSAFGQKRTSYPKAIHYSHLIDMALLNKGAIKVEITPIKDAIPNN